MDVISAGVPLALSTMFLLVGAGSFMVMAVLSLVSPVEGRRLRGIDTLSLMPSLAVVLGFATLCLGFQDATGAADLLRGGVGAVRFALLTTGGAFAVAALAYGVLAVSGKMPETLRRPLLRGAGVLGLLFACVLGLAHTLVADPSWNTLATPVQMLGLALLGGAALATMMYESAGALDAPAAKRMLAACVVVGVVLGAGGFAVQVALVSGMANGAGAGLVSVASTHVAVGLICLAAVLVFAMMALRLKETGFHSVVAVACAFVGVFCVRLAFYALQASTLA